MKSGEENGAALIFEPEASPIAMLWGIALSEGRHLRAGKTQYAPTFAAMPEFVPETNRELRRFRSEGRKVVLLATFHTHPNYPYSGDSADGDPSSHDVQTQSGLGNPLGIIRTGNGYSFYLDGKRFDPSDPKADQCVTFQAFRLQ